MVQCQFEQILTENGKEICYICPDDAEGIARCKELCRRHFRKIKQDNVYRIEHDLDIPEDTSLLIKDKWIKYKLVVKE